MRIVKVFICIWALGTISLMTGCENAEHGGGWEQPPVPVKLATVSKQPYARILELPGRISAVRIAEVRARAAGIVLRREFEEGTDVKQGQVLFRIDPASPDADLAKAKADLAKAEASMRNLKVTAERYKPLAKAGVISQQEYDDAVANYNVALSTMEAEKARVRSARLDKGYATVVAPISGRIGRAAVTEGSLVGQTEPTLLVTIQQLDPIYADITQPVSEYLQLREAMLGQDKIGKKAEVTVEVEEVGFSQKGHLLFSDVTVNKKTGQVSLRCEFPNPDDILLPGMFVRIKVQLSEENTIFVPQRSVQRGYDGSAHVYVVGDGDIAQVRPVTLGEMEGGMWEVVNGLTTGERIVANGVDKVKPGAPVAIDPINSESDAYSSVSQ